MSLDAETKYQIAALAGLIRLIMRGDSPKELMPVVCNIDETRELCETICQLLQTLQEAQDFIRDLSEGKLDAVPPTRNHLIAPFKQLHANLRHLNWQVQQVAAGDLNQRVDFLGEFSTAFNSLIASLRDKKQAEQALRRSETQYRSLIELCPDAVCVHREYTYVMVNHAGLALFGADSPDQIVGRPILDLVHQDFRDLIIRRISRVYETGESFPLTEVLLLRLDGAPIPAEVTTAPAIYQGEAAAQTVIRDVTARKEAEAKLRYFSSHDTLTGLYNRSFFTEELLRLERGRSFPVSILVADLDNLKQTNDTLGHAAGDRLIQHAAEILQDGVRIDDIVARIGGDEFAIILPSTRAEKAAEIMDRIRECALLHNRDNPEENIGISIGCATATEKGPLNPLLILADKRMYEDKAARKELAAGKTELD